MWWFDHEIIDQFQSDIKINCEDSTEYLLHMVKVNVKRSNFKLWTDSSLLKELLICSKEIKNFKRFKPLTLEFLFLNFFIKEIIPAAGKDLYTKNDS